MSPTGWFVHRLSIFAVLSRVFALLGTSLNGATAQAVSNDTLTVYYDAPFVQSSYLSGTANTLRETLQPRPVIRLKIIFKSLSHNVIVQLACFLHRDGIQSRSSSATL